MRAGNQGVPLMGALFAGHLDWRIMKCGLLLILSYSVYRISIVEILKGGGTFPFSDGLYHLNYKFTAEEADIKMSGVSKLCNVAKVCTAMT